MSRPTFALFVAALGLGLGTSRPASAQPMQQGAPVTVPQRVPHPTYGRSTGFDCVVEGLSLAVYPRRLTAFVEVGVRVRGVSGGMCAVRADAVQVMTGIFAGVGRFAGVFFEGGQSVWPGETTEYRNINERLEPWAADLKPNEARTVTFRGVYEGDLNKAGEPELVTRMRVQLAMLGPRVAPNAPVDARVAFEPNLAGRVGMAMGGEKFNPEPVAAGATYQTRQLLARDKTAPIIDWHYEGEGPAEVTAATALSSPLATIEYLRHRLVSDFAAAFASKDAKRVAATWDESFDVAFAAARSQDPLVAGVGLRAFAWLANGLNATAWRVRAASEGGVDEAVVVPDAVAADLAKVVPNFQRLIGDFEPPSPVGARSARAAAAHFGDPGDNKKAADEAMGRFVKRLDQARARRAPVLFAAYPPMAPSTRTLDISRVIEYRPTGPKLVPPTAGRGGVEVKATPARRLVRALTHPRRSWRSLLALVALGGAAAGLAALLRPGRLQRHASSV